MPEQIPIFCILLMSEPTSTNENGSYISIKGKILKYLNISIMLFYVFKSVC